MSGIILAGTHSGSGKTTVTLAILAALAARGITVQAFKAGPDFIDPGLHRLVSGRPARNLDLWMCGEKYVTDCYHRHTAGADFALVEGAMGLYDGQYCPARLATVLDLPVILVIDAFGIAESAGAIAQGYHSFSPGNAAGDFRPIKLAGVIFNRVAGEAHFQRLRRHLGDIPAMGYLPRDEDFSIPHRHLGLMTAAENPLTKTQLDNLARAASRFLDLDGITGLGRAGSPVPPPADPAGPEGTKNRAPVRIGYALDKAFCFYYDDNLDLLAAVGAQLVPFSPLADRALPRNIDALYLGGGYPELYARQLSENIELREEIRRRAQAGMPVYGECGGMIYLSQGVFDLAGVFHPFTAVLPFQTKMRKKLARLGYREIVLKADGLLGTKGTRLRGHEFHYSEIVDPPEEAVFSVIDQRGDPRPDDGYRTGNILAGYVHLHFGANPQAAACFVNAAREASWKT